MQKNIQIIWYTISIIKIEVTEVNMGKQITETHLLRETYNHRKILGQMDL